jgi:Uncharacterized protein conserved in bacteria
MMITRLEKGTQNKVKVYLDDEFAFLLYTSDIKRHHLAEQEELPEDTYHCILEETVFRRAKQKAMAILKRMDRTESELYTKLVRADYTDEIARRAIEYVKGFHYLDDERYALHYIQLKRATKSRIQIRMELIQKGIERETIDLLLQEECSDDNEAIQKAIRRKTNDVDSLSYEQKQKLAASLYRKGFSKELIYKYINFKQSYEHFE